MNEYFLDLSTNRLLMVNGPRPWPGQACLATPIGAGPGTQGTQERMGPGILRSLDPATLAMPMPWPGYGREPWAMSHEP